AGTVKANSSTHKRALSGRALSGGPPKRQTPWDRLSIRYETTPKTGQREDKEIRVFGKPRHLEPLRDPPSGRAWRTIGHNPERFLRERRDPARTVVQRWCNPRHTSLGTKARHSATTPSKIGRSLDYSRVILRRRSISLTIPRNCSVTLSRSP